MDEGSIEAEPKRPWRFRSTVAIVAVVVMAFVAGTSLIGIAHQITWWAQSPEPTLTYMGSAREPARRSSSLNNLKQIGLGLHNYADDHDKTFPAGSTMSSWGRLEHGWQAALLPYVEEKPLYEKIDFEHPWNHPINQEAYKTPIALFINPHASGPEVDNRGYPFSDYSANVRVLRPARPMPVAEITDGTAKTILAGEAVSNRKPWAAPGNWRDPAAGINVPGGFGGPWKSRGANFLFADGHVSFLSEDIDPKVLRTLATPADGDRVGDGVP